MILKEKLYEIKIEIHIFIKPKTESIWRREELTRPSFQKINLIGGVLKLGSENKLLYIGTRVRGSFYIILFALSVNITVRLAIKSSKVKSNESVGQSALSITFDKAPGLIKPL